ncbi:MAG: hypothetical protein SVX43_22600, partial [Cyanobacteriota bacterium]|nr:hypothetical protein [Cyanobacteriota bacterium]
IKIVRGNGLACYYIRMLRLKTWQKPLAFLLYVAKDLFSLVVHFFKSRSVLETDLEAACKLEHLKACLASPFFLSKKYLSELVISQKIRLKNVARPSPQSVISLRSLVGLERRADT